MSEMDYENKLRAIANGMEYPRTPNIAGSVTARLRNATRPRVHSKALVWSLTIILVLCSSLMLIPPARAAILEFIQIGVVRIFPQPVEPTIKPIRTVTPAAATPSSQESNLTLLLDKIAGETELTNAQQIAGYPILLPSYPPGLGLPNHVYVQDADGAMTILVWLAPQNPDHITLSLHFIPDGSWAIDKMGPKVIQEVKVSGQRAIWAEGPYPLRMRDGDLEFTRLIEGNVLIWTLDDVTYRLETDLSLEEAVRIAESLEPIP